jgi:flagellar biosynthesis GTPase FlhF
MRRLKKDALFSANACRERYSALIEGTARIPSEVADDPEASRAELAAFCKEREKARRDEEAKKSNQVTLRKRRKDEAAAHAAQRAEEAANKRAAKEAEKADRARKRAEKAQEKAQSALKIQKEKQERHSRAKKQATMVVNEAVTREAEPPTEKTKAPIKTTLILASKSTLPKKPALPFSSKTPDPRSFLSLPDLRRLCAARGFRVSGKTKKMLLSDIQNEESKWKLYTLKAMCKTKGLAASGTKPLLRHRLALSNANEFVLSDSEMEATQVESEGGSDGYGDDGETDGDGGEEIADDMSLDAE